MTVGGNLRDGTAYVTTPDNQSTSGQSMVHDASSITVWLGLQEREATAGSEVAYDDLLVTLGP
jgi:hypothetical protein